MTFQGEDEVSKRNFWGGVILYVSAVVTLLMMLGPVIYGLYIGPPKPVNARKTDEDSDANIRSGGEMARQIDTNEMARQIEEWKRFVREVLEPCFDGALEEWAMTPRAKRESKTPFEAQERAVAHKLME
eukprot:CAMPEP_0198224654 /NCGR_PEP_ID=MMETSP1445-20131203/97797_1 /TAXON_ID=36898 /ORGANISM="Pyramimonas sp., Strain CCMP2087" /LENGTH=128 /DNA_ID=CAMNT_0043903889 /DNA_START=54 /DNA_END=438 /DNA_ORIENTATION=-